MEHDEKKDKEPSTSSQATQPKGVDDVGPGGGGPDGVNATTKTPPRIGTSRPSAPHFFVVLNTYHHKQTTNRLLLMNRRRRRRTSDRQRQVEI
jgi:hypothetical protein